MNSASCQGDNLQHLTFFPEKLLDMAKATTLKVDIIKYYMDFKEAFDSVSHNNALLPKKKDLCISGRLWSRFKICQSTHVQRVRIGETPISVCR